MLKTWYQMRSSLMSHPSLGLQMTANLLDNFDADFGALPAQDAMPVPRTAEQPTDNSLQEALQAGCRSILQRTMQAGFCSILQIEPGVPVPDAEMVEEVERAVQRPGEHLRSCQDLPCKIQPQSWILMGRSVGRFKISRVSITICIGPF